jgi:hypothetical protein
MIPAHFESQLLTSAKRIISLVCQKQMGTMKRRPASEVDFIASLIENGANMLERDWKRILAAARIDVSVAGVFCHQSPKVKISGSPPRSMRTQSCELADLLVLHSHRTAANRLFFRATFIQAKKYCGAAVIPDDPQFWLYDDWPPFSIASPGFNRRIREFGCDTRSGQYALVSNSSWKIMSANNPLVAQSMQSLDFSTFLVRTLYDMDPAQRLWRSSYGRQVYDKSSKDWSKTVWDIVKVTGRMKLKHAGKKMGLYHGALPTRFGGEILAFLTAQPKSYIIPPAPTEEAEAAPGGMSIFYIASAAELSE